MQGESQARITWESHTALFVQALVEDGYQAGTFYALLDGRVTDGAGLYRSVDWGESWHPLTVSLPPHLNQLPYQRHWIEAELLSVVVYQVRMRAGVISFVC